MLPSPALRVQLARDFHRLTYNAKDPCEIVDVVFALQDAVSGCLRELMRSWSPASGSQRLLEDALARAIAFLPFHDRIVASQVSRGWRATALRVPAIWSDIEVCASMLSPVDVLAMALARTGRHPLDLCVRGHTLHNLPTQALLQTLEPHRHRLRSLTWTGSPSPPASFFARPLPCLESLKYDGTWSGGGAFLGGRVGRLQTLHLARFRPPSTGSGALSSVTDLSFGILAAASDPSPDYGLSALFTLFPRLRALEISRVAAEHVPILRALRPPASLAALALRSDDRSGGCNLLSLCGAWDCERMKDVRLSMPMASYQTKHQSTLLVHCARLSLELFTGERGLRVVCTDCGGRTRSVALVADDDSSGRVFSVCRSILQAHKCLAHVRSLAASMEILPHIRSEELALPELKEVVLFFEEKPISRSASAYQWPWSVFKPCGAFTRSFELTSVAVEMRCLNGTRPPDVEDGRMLLTKCIGELVDPMRRDRLSIGVRGLPESVAYALSVELQSLSIACEVGTIVQPTVL